jgi:hypothetical protein
VDVDGDEKETQRRLNEYFMNIESIIVISPSLRKVSSTFSLGFASCVRVLRQVRAFRQRNVRLSSGKLVVARDAKQKQKKRA